MNTSNIIALARIGYTAHVRRHASLLRGALAIAGESPAPGSYYAREIAAERAILSGEGTYCADDLNHAARAYAAAR